MVSTIKETLSQHLTALNEQITELQRERDKIASALAVYENSDALHASSSGSRRFVDMMPFKAIQILLRENGGRMSRHALMDALIAGGATEGKKRGHHNLRISIDVNTSLGKLRQDGSDIILAESEPAAVNG